MGIEQREREREQVTLNYHKQIWLKLKYSLKALIPDVFENLFEFFS